ncbi:MAG TPA: acyl-CoA dehydratase activase-related protein, partial [Spirochaetia bacterium]|nr:acyl-CoA dehydratase activase-related protein [Spirochaetia bacterium]
STTTKVVLLRLSDHAILGSVYLRTNGNPVEASRSCFRGLVEELGGVDVDILGIGVTGSGRQIAGLYTLTEGIINEIIAHASAAVYFDPDVDTIFEIGGQDAKYTYITNSVASDYAMNQACSAGTGSFLEEAAFETLGVRMEEIADLAVRGGRPPNFNDQCAAFISSDIKNAIHEGITQNDILAGLVYSICLNYINRVKGARPVGGKVFLQGGVCYNRAVPLAMAGILRKPIVVPPEPGLMGAFGVALELEKRISLGLIEEKHFDLGQIINRKIRYRDPFVCAGGREKCDLKCSIMRIEIAGKVYPFGGACNRYYNLRFEKREADTELDFVKRRNALMFRKAAAGSPASGPLAAGQPTVGLNNSFLTLSLYPLYSTFLSALGCRIVFPDGVSAKAVNRLVTSLCFPAEISIGTFENLMDKKPDYIFLPHAKELYVPGGIERLDFCSTCGFSRGEGFILRHAFRGNEIAERILSPTVIFNGGWEKGERALCETARQMGFRKTEAREAFRMAVKAQYAFDEECGEIGRLVLEELHSDPGRIAIVLFGRPYNAYAPEANKGIPKKLTSRGYTVIPYEMLPYQDEPLGEAHAEYMHWETGQKILRAAQIVKRDRQLYGVYITNFLCAPDSFLVPYFRKVMGTKPSLTLELDAHAADAGINTRIEAFLDIVQNYRKIQSDVKDTIASGYRPAKISYEPGGVVFIDSEGKRFNLTDPAVKLVMPPMGIFASRGLAAVCRKIGIRTEALPPSDSELLRMGRSVTTGKECLPLIICIGALVRYLEHRSPAQESEKLLMLLPKASGHCRLGQYHVYANLFIRENLIGDVAMLDLGMEDRFAGLGPAFGLNAWKSVVVSDVLEDIAVSILTLAEDPDEGKRIFDEECEKVLGSLDGSSGKNLYRQLRESALRFRDIPLRASYEETARVAVTGEFFVRRDPFSNLGIAQRLARKGFLVTTDSIAGIIYYANFMIKEKIVQPRYTLAGWLEFFISEKTQRHVEKKIKTILSVSGLFTLELIDIWDLIRHSEFLIPKDCDGEQGIIAGLTMRDSLTEYCGIANVGPFGCMQTRFADAVIIPQADVKGKLSSLRFAGKEQKLEGFTEEDRIPFLSVESDGNPYPQLLEARLESFCLEAARIAVRQGKRVAPERGAPGREPG